MIWTPPTWPVEWGPQSEVSWTFGNYEGITSVLPDQALRSSNSSPLELTRLNILLSLNIFWTCNIFESPDYTW